MSDNMRVPDVAKMTALLFGVDSSAIFWASIYFRYVSKNWQAFYAIPFVINLIANICLILQNEGPKFYFGKENYEETRQILTQIGRRNKVLGVDQKYSKVFKKEVQRK